MAVGVANWGRSDWQETLYGDIKQSCGWRADPKVIRSDPTTRQTYPQRIPCRVTHSYVLY